jgi:hypothetical protein
MYMFLYIYIYVCIHTHTVSFFVVSLRVSKIRLTHFQSAELEADVQCIFEAPNWAGHERSSVFSGADCDDPEEPWGNWDRCSKSPEAFTIICTALRELPASGEKERRTMHDTPAHGRMEETREGKECKV